MTFFGQTTWCDTVSEEAGDLVPVAARYVVANFGQLQSNSAKPFDDADFLPRVFLGNLANFKCECCECQACPDESFGDFGSPDEMNSVQIEARLPALECQLYLPPTLVEIEQCLTGGCLILDVGCQQVPFSFAALNPREFSPLFFFQGCYPVLPVFLGQLHCDDTGAQPLTTNQEVRIEVELPQAGQVLPEIKYFPIDGNKGRNGQWDSRQEEDPVRVKLAQYFGVKVAKIANDKISRFHKCFVSLLERVFGGLSRCDLKVSYGLLRIVERCVDLDSSIWSGAAGTRETLGQGAMQRDGRAVGDEDIPNRGNLHNSSTLNFEPFDGSLCDRSKKFDTPLELLSQSLWTHTNTVRGNQLGADICISDRVRTPSSKSQEDAKRIDLALPLDEPSFPCNVINSIFMKKKAGMLLESERTLGRPPCPLGNDCLDNIIWGPSSKKIQHFHHIYARESAKCLQGIRSTLLGAMKPPMPLALGLS